MKFSRRNEQIISKEAERNIMQAVHCSPLLARLLISRGNDTPEKALFFLNNTALTDPFEFQDMQKSVDLILNAIEKQDKIVVYGDYDCDGICASALLVSTLQQMNANVDVYIPDRESEGYGLHVESIHKIALSAKLLITVDCGISANKEIQLAKELGLTVILTDHHMPPEELPNADAIVCAKVQGPALAEHLCGCGIAFKLASALGADVQKTLPIAAIATVGDIVPLIGENRSIVKLGLSMINKNMPVFLSAIIQQAQLHADELTSTQIAFTIVPRINAAGRMGDAMAAYNLLMEKDEQRACLLAKKLCEYNTKRQMLEGEIMQEAQAQIEASPLGTSRAVYAFGEGWHPGVIGIVASRLSEHFHMPAIVATLDEKDRYVASLRSIPGINIFNGLKQCESLFVRYGGHAQAGGFTLEKQNKQKFIDEFENYLRNHYQSEDFVSSFEYDDVLEVNDISVDLIHQLHRLEPFGFGNPSPNFLLENVIIRSKREFGKTATHIKYTISDAVATGQAVLYRAPSSECITLKSVYRLLGHLYVDTFRDREEGMLKISAYEPMSKAKFWEENLFENIGVFIRNIQQSCSKEHHIVPCQNVDTKAVIDWIESDPFGTLLIANTRNAVREFLAAFHRQSKLNVPIFDYFNVAYQKLPESQNSQNSLLVAPRYPIENAQHYTRWIFLDTPINLQTSANHMKIYRCGNSASVEELAASFLISRERMARIYRSSVFHTKFSWDSIDMFCAHIASETEESTAVVCAIFTLFLSCGFFQIKTINDRTYVDVCNHTEKVELCQTPIYLALSKVASGGDCA